MSRSKKKTLNSIDTQEEYFKVILNRIDENYTDFEELISIQNELRNKVSIYTKRKLSPYFHYASSCRKTYLAIKKWYDSYLNSFNSIALRFLIREINNFKEKELFVYIDKTVNVEIKNRYNKLLEIIDTILSLIEEKKEIYQNTSRFWISKPLLRLEYMCYFDNKYKKNIKAIQDYLK